MRPCEKVKTNSERCRNAALKGDKYCFFHSPNNTKERRAASRRGGDTVARMLGVTHLPVDTPDFPLKTHEDTLSLLAKTMNWVLRGEVATQVANSVGYLAGIYLKVKEYGELEERMDALEKWKKEVSGR